MPINYDNRVFSSNDVDTLSTLNQEAFPEVSLVTMMGTAQRVRDWYRYKSWQWVQLNDTSYT